MAYSSIERKKCKCGDCNKYPSLGYNGYNYSCAPEEIKEKVGSKKDLQIKKQNARKAISVKLRAENRKVTPISDLELYFRICRHKMTGNCIECGKSTQKKDDTYFFWSIAHICAKSTVPSVALHPENWLELCQQHHQEFDNTFERASKMMCFIEAKRKFQLFKDLIPPEELRKVNPYLFQT